MQRIKPTEAAKHYQIMNRLIADILYVHASTQEEFFDQSFSALEVLVSSLSRLREEEWKQLIGQTSAKVIPFPGRN